jgi:hypothetical protein
MYNFKNNSIFKNLTQKTMKKIFFLLANLFLINQLAFAQSVTIVPANPASPTKGTMNYNNATNQLQYWNAAAWIPITNAASGTGWALSGNHIYSSNTGFVGIGTTTPLHKLSVVTPTFAYGFTHSDGNITMGSWMTATTAQFGTKSNHPLEFFTNNGSAQMTLLQNGNVGIGTNFPIKKLDIVHAGVDGFRVKSTVSYSAIEVDAFNGDAALRFFDNGNLNWVIRTNPLSNNLDIFHTTNDVNVSNNLTVNAGKGIVRSINGTQLQTELFVSPNNIALPNWVNGMNGCFSIGFNGLYSAPPRISISDTEGITNADNLLITVKNVTNSTASICLRHIGNQTVSSTNGIIRAIIIGPQ